MKESNRDMPSHIIPYTISPMARHIMSEYIFIFKGTQRCRFFHHFLLLAFTFQIVLIQCRFRNVVCNFREKLLVNKPIEITQVLV
jgi:hypothetical protein